MNYTDKLRLLAFNDARVADDLLGPSKCDSSELDPKRLALARLAALVAVGGTVQSYGAHADAALNAGASATEIVAVLTGVVDIVGVPCVVTAAPSLAMALGYDTDDAMEL